MSGHSKWSNIKRKKGAADAERGKVFQKIAKEIYVAAKSGTPDIDQNASLRMVVEKAKAANMPKDNIQKAIDKAKGAGDGEHYDQIRYEGYGPVGVAVMVDCLTDNKNRTASFVRSTFTKKGGNLGTDGSVSYMFERKGSIVIPNSYNEDEIMLTSLDNGALDIINDGENYNITTTPENLLKVKDALTSIGVDKFFESEVTYLPNMEVEVQEEEQREKVIELVEQLEDLDDVQSVYFNMKD